MMDFDIVNLKQLSAKYKTKMYNKILKRVCSTFKQMPWLLSMVSNINNNLINENQQSGFPTRSETNRPVQSQKQARSLKFQIKEEKE